MGGRMDEWVGGWMNEWMHKCDEWMRDRSM